MDSVAKDMITGSGLPSAMDHVENFLQEASLSLPLFGIALINPHSLGKSLMLSG